MSNQPEAGSIVVVRRRRTGRHRRNRRLRRALLITVCVAAALSFSSIALRYLTPSLFRAAFHHTDPSLAEQAAQKALDEVQQESAREMVRRPMYPYSVVTGGVRSSGELRYAVDHDPVVASHYAGFDYAHARVVQSLMERWVYVSYRMGNRVYWTRHRVKLKKGEKLLTDGKITARIRCANRVEEKPQQESSRMEPPAVAFDEPAMPAMGTALQIPAVPFETALNRPPGVGSAPPLGLYDPIGGGGWTPISLPPLPSVCGVDGKKKPVTGTTGSGKNKNVNPCGGGGGSEVPEPATWLLLGSGIAAVYWKARQRLAHS